MTELVASIFISYSHADKPLAQALAKALEAKGIKVWIDERELRVGDSIIERVATAVAQTDFFIALVSESSRESRWCKKELHLAITGELGREGVQVLPLRVGDVEMPDTLRDVLYLDVDPEYIEPTVERLVNDVRHHATQREQPETPALSPPLPPPAPAEGGSQPEVGTPANTADADAQIDEPIRIEAVVREGIGEPRNDGTPGSALYRVPLRLSRRPSELWKQVFENEWNNQFYSMLREAHVQADTIVFPKTTMEELEHHHVGQLRQVLDRVNRRVAEIEREARISAQREGEERAALKRQHDESVARVSERLKFD